MRATLGSALLHSKGVGRVGRQLLVYPRTRKNLKNNWWQRKKQENVEERKWTGSYGSAKVLDSGLGGNVDNVVIWRATERDGGWDQNQAAEGRVMGRGQHIGSS